MAFTNTSAHMEVRPSPRHAVSLPITSGSHDPVRPHRRLSTWPIEETSRIGPKDTGLCISSDEHLPCHLINLQCHFLGCLKYSERALFLDSHHRWWSRALHLDGKGTGQFHRSDSSHDDNMRFHFIRHESAMNLLGYLKMIDVVRTAVNNNLSGNLVKNLEESRNEWRKSEEYRLHMPVASSNWNVEVPKTHDEWRGRVEAAKAKNHVQNIEDILCDIGQELRDSSVQERLETEEEKRYSLERDAKAAGLKVTFRSGVFFKAMANFQWDQILKTDIISKEYLDGCFALGQQYPELCSSIFLVCEKG